jgi:hypothetical protein
MSTSVPPTRAGTPISFDVQKQQTTTPRELDDAQGLVIGAVWAAIFLVLFGARVAGLVLFAVALTGWVLWRHRRRNPSA